MGRREYSVELLYTRTYYNIYFAQQLPLYSHKYHWRFFPEDYTEPSQSSAHVRRLLDIVACTTRFAKPKAQVEGRAKKARAHAPSGPQSPPPPNGEVRPPPSSEPPVALPVPEGYEMAAIHPVPKLSDFYEFFSFSHLPPPILREFFFSSSSFHFACISISKGLKKKDVYTRSILLRK